MPRKKTKETQAEQSKAFKEKAREIGADAEAGADDEVMRRLAKQNRHQAAKKAD